MMDYKGLYNDLADMKRRALNELKRCEIAGTQEQAERLDDFIWEIETFLGLIIVRKW